MFSILRHATITTKGEGERMATAAGNKERKTQRDM
jgi:hypothetical protein